MTAGIADDAEHERLVLRAAAMNDVGAASLLPEGVPISHRPDDETRRATLPPPPPVSSPPTLNGDRRKTPEIFPVNDEDVSVKADSEAETIIQSGREELSPEKKRTFIRHSVGERDGGPDNNGGKGVPISPDGWKSRKRRRVDDGARDVADSSRAQRRSSSSGSSGRSSPMPKLKRERTEDPGILNTTHDISRESSEGPRISRTNEPKIRPASEGVVPHDVRAGETRQRENKQISDSSLHLESDDLDNNKNNSYQRRIANDRSISPAVRSHRRAVSTSLHSSILPSKKRRAPPPLLVDYQRHRSEDRESISSSTSGSPLPHLKPRRFASGEFSAGSPAKQMAGQKKTRDQNGRTKLARTCAIGDVDGARAFLEERPEDLDVRDNAGNTPLQIASLGGYTEIVELLLAAHCDVHTKNGEKDTPLIDAVENGHLEVVKLLLEAGANPRVGNASGDEPYDLVPPNPDPDESGYLEEVERLEKLRVVLKEARAKAMKLANVPPRKSEDHPTATSSPRELTPVIGFRSPPPQGRRNAGRREATRNDRLWISPTPENLRKFAAKGDGEGVGSVLQILQKADTESILAAAKGGHDEVLNLMLALGDPDPDPQPLKNGNHKPGFNTPMLAAIGRGHVRVIELLLGQSGFNPTRLDYRGRKYYEISEERKGENWDEEYELLKSAYDNYTPPARGRKLDTRSPRKPRDKDRSVRSTLRRESTSPELTARRKPMKSSLSSLSKDDRMAIERKKREGHPNKSHRDEDRLSMGSSDQDAPSRRKHRTSPEIKQHDDNGISHGEEPVRRRRLFRGGPAGRRASLISSDSISSRDEGAKPISDSVCMESKQPQPSSPMKRPHASLSPNPEGARGYDDGDKNPQGKRRRVDSQDAVPIPSNKKEPTNEESRSESLKRQEENTLLQRIESEDNSAHTKHDERTTAIPASAHHEFSTPVATDNTDSYEVADKKTKGTQEAEERHLADLAKHEKAQEAKASKDAEEAKEATEKAARAAREKAEEEERKRKETESRLARQAEEEHQKRLEHERVRQARLRREQEEHERKRREALPNRLRSAAELIGTNHPRAKSHEWLQRFFPLATVTTRQIEPACDHNVEEERWLPNYQVAPLLATNDLQLSQYPSWEKRQASQLQRFVLWRTTRNILTENDILNPLIATPQDSSARCKATRPKFDAMEHIFWVRLSDFMDLVPHIPHLHGLKLQTMDLHVPPESIYPSPIGSSPSLTNGNRTPHDVVMNGTTPE